LAQFVYSSFKKNDARKEDLDTIIQEVDRLNLLIVQVLDFAKIKKLNLSQFYINELIVKIVEFLKLEIKNKKIDFYLSLSQDISSICADENQVRQIIMNVVINSIQAIKIKGKIKITTENSRLKEKPAIKLIIEDNGIGIPESELSQIFDPFFTKKDKGTGLGLSIVYKLVENHQGEVKVESIEGKGTKFLIFLIQKGVE